MEKADVKDGDPPGVNDDDVAEFRATKKRIRLLELENEALRRAAASLSQANLPEMVFPLIREMAPAGALSRLRLRCRSRWRAGSETSRHRATTSG